MKCRFNIAIVRGLVTGAVVALAFLTMPNTGSAASDVGIRIGYFVDSQAVSFGLEMLTPLSVDSRDWYFNPNMEIAMGDTRDMAMFNFDFHYDFETGSNLAVWAGAGPALILIDRDPFREDLDAKPGIDLLLGLGAKTGSARPFVQGKAVVMDNPEAAIAVGIRF